MEMNGLNIDAVMNLYMTRAAIAYHFVKVVLLDAFKKFRTDLPEK